MKKQSALTMRWLSKAVGTATLLGIGLSSHAAIIETEDNGTFATADAAAGGDTLMGNVGTPAADPSYDPTDYTTADLNDVDIWQFSLNANQAFTASISYQGVWNPYDTNPIMTLYWENGGAYYPVASTDPDSFGTAFGFTPWVSGNYFLAVTSDFNMGVDAFGNFQSDWSFQTGLWFPNDPNSLILGTPWAGWHGQSFTSFAYTINTHVVPVPAAVWLFGSGLLGLIGMARKRARSV